MKYLFILGTNQTLSIAEIFARFSDLQKPTMPQTEVLIAETDKEIEAINEIKRLGGTIKIGRILDVFDYKDKDGMIDFLFNHLQDKKRQGKLKFGISYYGQKNFRTEDIGLELKKRLKALSLSARFVTSREKNLSSVVVGQNKLLTEGAEFVFIQDGFKIIVGATDAIQPYKELSARDYGRPARDDQSGMLPPKLAQIMINLTQTGPGSALLDPFCGSGTILTEALLMGYQNLTGADISSKAVEDTKINIEWTIKNNELKIKNYELFIKSATDLSKILKPNSTDAIITEPYLGPQRGKADVHRTKKELEMLYSKSLVEFQKVLKPGGRVVMIWPVFRSGKNLFFLNPNINKFKIINPIPNTLKSSKYITPTNRDTVIYGRSNQDVWREIVLLKK